jgi:aryl-alcohol dehydrogenase-like predicted oxidoreductase
MTAPRPKRTKPTSPSSAASPVGDTPLPGSPKPHPPIGIGLWALGRWKREDEDRTRTVLETAVTEGIRWFDTAEVYGNGRSERLLGEIFERSPALASESFVVTKVSWEHLRPSQVVAALTQSLERLGLPSVDLYLIHAPDPKVPLKETLATLEELWRRGKVKALGVSNFSLEELSLAVDHLSEARIVVNQVRFNLLDRADAEPIQAFCRDRGILLEAYTPLARGLLSGRYLQGRSAPAEVRRFAQRFFEGDRWPVYVERARRIRDLAERAGVPMASLALHWLRAQGAAPVFGASRPSQVQENMAAWRSVPDASLLQEADELARGERA